MWLLALSVNLGLFVSSSLLKRRYAQDTHVPASVMMALSYGLGVMPISICVGLLVPHSVHWSTWLWFLLFVEGIGIALYNWLSFISLKLLPAAHYQTIFQLRLVVIILLGSLVLGETLSPVQLIGAGLIFVSAFLAIQAPIRAHSKRQDSSPHMRRGIGVAVISTIAIGIGLIAEKASLHHMDLGAYFIFGFGMQFVWLVVFAGLDTQRTRPAALTKRAVSQATLLGLLSAAIGFSYLWALNAANNISLVQAISSFAVPLTAVAAHIFLGEKDDSKLLWAAIAIGVFGVIITVL